MALHFCPLARNGIRIMNIKQVLFAGMLALPAVAMAKGSVSGTVLNGDTFSPMDFVNVTIVNAKTGKPLQIAASTDEQGKFTLADVPDGDYIVKISNVGSVDQERKVTISGGDVNLGDIRLNDDA